MKVCCTCKVAKPLSDYGRDKDRTDGLKHQCRQCKAEDSAKWRAANPEKAIESRAQYYKNNQKKIAEKNARWRKNNKDKLNAYAAKRNATGLQATPVWADYAQIAAIYKLADMLSSIRGAPYHVDHIYPLQGKLVCGLHVHQNLQVLPSNVNLSKSNNVRPDVVGLTMADIPESLAVMLAGWVMASNPSRSCYFDAHTDSLSIEQRFWEKVDVRGPDECWPWTGSLIKKGYGQLRSGKGNQLVRAHRVAYELQNGLIPQGSGVRHTCDSRSCCNGRHLVLGTAADIVAKCISRGRNAIGEKAGRAILLETTVKEIRRRYAIGGVTTRSLASEYEMSKSAIWMIVSGSGWKHV